MTDSKTFTDTELMVISLVLSQNADEYDVDYRRKIYKTSKKAREMASEQSSSREQEGQ